MAEARYNSCNAKCRRRNVHGGRGRVEDGQRMCQSEGALCAKLKILYSAARHLFLCLSENAQLSSILREVVGRQEKRWREGKEW